MCTHGLNASSTLSLIHACVHTRPTANRVPPCVQIHYTRQFVNTTVDDGTGINLGVTFHTDLEAAALASSAALPSSPAYVNAVTFRPNLSFILRRLQAQADEAAL